MPHTIFEEPPGDHHNRLVIRLQPDDSVELHLLAKASNRAKAEPGRLDLFVRYDEQLAAWRWVEPILEAWAADISPPRQYAAGTWGPNASIVLTARDGTSWPDDD